MSETSINPDKVALSGSQAGMRLIAQMKLYNDHNLDRLKAFISDSYTDAQLEERPVDERLSDHMALMAQIGRQKVKQVLATNKHYVSIVTTAEKVGGFFYIEMQVEEEYPHKISKFLHAPLEVSAEDNG